MDVKQYYRKVREVASTLRGRDIFVISLETSDGGKPGVVSEVSRDTAAKLIVEGRAVVASDEETRAYLEQQIATRKAAHKADLARRVQVAIIADPNLEPACSVSNGDESSNRK